VADSTSRPRVLANFAISADGKISTREYAPTGFTSSADKQRLREIRALGDALMVGRRTLETDQMSMTLSQPELIQQRVARGQAQFPLRVIVTRLGKVSADWKIFQREGGPILFVTEEPLRQYQQAPWRKAVEIYSRKQLDLGKFLTWLRREKRVRTVVCEGGPTLLRALIEQDLLDEIYLTIAPLIFGGEGAPSLTGPPGEFLSRVKKFRLIEARRVKDEIFCHYQRGEE
jgi:riboflavin-specific deaminase-like protein